jgi:hypothetical protein
MIEVLLIGGPADGRRILMPLDQFQALREREYWDVPVFGPRPLQDNITIHAYRPERFREGKREFTVLVYRDIPSIVARLIRRYPAEIKTPTLTLDTPR